MQQLVTITRLLTLPNNLISLKHVAIRSHFFRKLLRRVGQELLDAIPVVALVDSVNPISDLWGVAASRWSGPLHTVSCIGIESRVQLLRFYVARGSRCSQL